MKKIITLSIIASMLLTTAHAGGEFQTINFDEVDYMEAQEIPLECPALPIASTQPVKPCPEPEIIYKDKIVEKIVYRDPVPKPKKSEKPNGFYAAIGITDVKYKDCIPCKGKYKDTTYGVVGRVGYDLNPYVGVEVRGSKTNWDYHGTKIKHMGAFIKPMIPLNDTINVYGLAGYAKTDVRNTSIPHVHKEGLALGAGFEVDLSKDTPKDGKYARSFDGQGDQENGLGFFIDYERMHVKKDSKVNLDAVSAGITYDF